MHTKALIFLIDEIKSRDKKPFKKIINYLPTKNINEY